MTGAGNDGHLEGARVLEHGFGCLNIIKTGEQMHNVKRKRFFRFNNFRESEWKKHTSGMLENPVGAARQFPPQKGTSRSPVMMWTGALI